MKTRETHPPIFLKKQTPKNSHLFFFPFNDEVSYKIKNKLWRAFFYSAAHLQWAVSRTIHRLRKNTQAPVHILFCLCDHFEPGTGYVNPAIEKERMKTLLTTYPGLAKAHLDFYGNPLKRTWFFPPHYHRYNNLRELVTLCEQGYGEIELHLHHGKIKPDTSENLKRTLEQCIEEYGHFGIFGSEQGQKKYGFTHGNFALDNSQCGRNCGVNDEIRILSDTGCYADFSFPSLNITSPIRINSIFYATDNPRKPKSYNFGHRVKRTASPGCDRGDLMLIQGPVYPSLRRKGPFRVFNGDDINGKPPKTQRDVDHWVDSNIHVQGQKNWIIIKTHTHGATTGDAVLGREMKEICRMFEMNYNDGIRYRLHYVTARELYNIVRAAESGEKDENPEVYRDYKIAPPPYDGSVKISRASAYLQELVGRTYA